MNFKQIFICLIISTLRFSSLLGQSTFEIQLGGQLDEEGVCIRQTSTGNIIVMGNYLGYPELIEGKIELYNIDSAGNEVWHKTINQWPGYLWGNNLEITSDSCYIITGSYMIDGLNNVDLLLMKLDKDGEIEWFNTYDSLESSFNYTSYEEGRDVKQLNDGGYIISGVAGLELLVVRTDSIGNILWDTKHNPLYRTYGNSILQTIDNSLLVAGTTTSFSPIDTSLIILIKLDLNGGLIWERTYSWYGGDNAAGVSLCEVPNKEYIISGTGYYSGIQLGEILFLRTDTAGNAIDQKSYNYFDYSVSDDIYATADCGYVLTGYTDEVGGDIDLILVKTDSVGDHKWSKIFGGNGWDSGNSVIQTSDLGFAIAGWTYSYGSGMKDIYVIKTNQFGNIVSIQNTPVTKGLNICPNPMTNEALIEIPEDSDINYDIKVELFSIDGSRLEFDYSHSKTNIILHKGNIKKVFTY